MTVNDILFKFKIKYISDNPKIIKNYLYSIYRYMTCWKQRYILSRMEYNSMYSKESFLSSRQYSYEICLAVAISL